MGLTVDQERVVKMKSQNVIVSAGAGSGKTFVLTQRVINLLKNEHYKLKDLVILTFTDLAAKEMKERIIKALSKETDESLKEELSHIDEADISTFDSFCSKFVRKYQHLSILSPSFQIGDNPFFQMKKEEFLREIINPYYSNNNEEFNKLVDLLDLNNDLKLISKLTSIYNEIINYEDHSKYLREYISNYYGDKFINSIETELLNTLKSQLEPIISYKYTRFPDSQFQDYLDNHENVATKVINTTSLKEAMDLLNNFKSGIAPKAKVSYKDEFNVIKESFKKLVGNAKRIVDNLPEYENIIKEYQESKPLYEFIINILIELDDRLEAFKKEYSIYTFSDIQFETIRILETFKDVQDYYKTHIKEVLIDEYQDTNDIGRKIASLISNNNLLVVGDVKQSIYRFRNANPQLFIDMYNDYKNDSSKGTVVELKKNFRSRGNEVLAPIAKIFNNICKNAEVNSDYLDNPLEYGQDKYSLHEDYLAPFSIIELKKPDKDDKSKKGDDEAEIIAKDIAYRYNSGIKTTVIDGETHEYRDVKYKDFLILAYESTHFESIARALEKYGIPSKVYKDASLFNGEEVAYIKNFLKLLNLYRHEDYNNPEFNKFVLALNKGFGNQGSEDDSMRYIKISKEKSNIDGIIEVFPWLIELLDRCSFKLYRHNAYEAIKEFVLTFAYYQKIINAEYGYEEKEIKVQYILDRLKSLSNMRLDLDDIYNYFDYLEKSQSDLNSRMAALDDLDCVRIMTIHKSKGLEAPYLYLFSLQRTKKYNEPIITKKYGINFSDVNRSIAEMTRRDEILEDRREKLRLLYVALTRAKESITLIVDEDLREYNEGLIGANTLQKLLEINNIFSSDSYRSAYDGSKKIKDKELPPALEVTERVVKMPEKTLKTLERASHELKIEIEVEDDSIYRYLERGEELHKIFEHISFLNDLDKQIENRGIDDKTAKLLYNFKDQLKFDDNLIREFHELPYYLDNINGIIDYMIEGENRFYIIDFKMKNIDDEGYIHQLHKYREYIEKRTNKPIETYLYSILGNELREIE